VTDPKPPLLACGGIVGMILRKPADPRAYLTLRIVHAQGEPTYPRGPERSDIASRIFSFSSTAFVLIEAHAHPSDFSRELLYLRRRPGHPGRVSAGVVKVLLQEKLKAPRHVLLPDIPVSQSESQISVESRCTIIFTLAESAPSPCL